MKYLILAAGKSKRIYKKIKKPKSLLKINNFSIIENILRNITHKKNKRSFFRKIFIILGFKQQLIRNHLKKYKEINFLYNPYYSKKDMLYSLICGLKKINDDVLVLYSDIYFDKKILTNIEKINKKKITLPVLSNWRKIWKIRNKLSTNDAEELLVDESKRKILKIGKKIKYLNKTKYQYMGMIYIPKKLVRYVIKFYEEKIFNDKMHITSFINELIESKIQISYIPINNFWYEIDDFQDYLNLGKIEKIDHFI